MKFSIITICFNAQNEIENTIKSVIEQTYSDYEYIIIDGASKDETLTIIESFKNKITKVISEKDNGIYDAMNKGWQQANGEFVIFMNAGDVFYSQKVLEQLAKNSSNADVLYGNWEVNYSWGKLEKKADELKTIFQCLPFSHQACAVKLSVLKQFGGFDSSFKICADYHFFLKAYLEKNVFCKYDFPIASISAGGFSDVNRLQAWEECESIRTSLGLKQTTELNKFLKKFKIKLVLFVKNIFGENIIALLTKWKNKF